MNETLKIQPTLEEPIVSDKYDLGSDPMPIQGLSDPEYYEKELELIWKRQWMYVGKEQYLPTPGSYFVKELPFAKTSIVIVRGRDNKVRAFHNVCSHRCNKLVWEESGKTNTMRCRFHGWVFGLDGKLEAVTDEQFFPKLDKDELGLVPVHCDVWEGFIMINLCPDPEPPLTLREYFGDFYDGLQGFPFYEMTREYKWVGEINCNWKLLRDAFCEVYHVAFIHPKTAAESFTSKAVPTVRSLSQVVTDYCAQYSMAANMDFFPPPTQALAFQLGGSAVQNTSQERFTEESGVKGLPKLINPSRALNWAGDLNFFFPSLGIPVFPGQYVLNHFMPVSPTRCRYELHLCFREPQNATERWTQEVSHTFFWSGVGEDLKTLENTQDVIESGAIKNFTLSDQETGVRQNHELVQKACGPYPDSKNA